MPVLKPMRSVSVSDTANSRYPLPLAMVCTEAAPASAHPPQPAPLFVSEFPLAVTFARFVHVTAWPCVVAGAGDGGGEGVGAGVGAGVVWVSAPAWVWV